MPAEVWVTRGWGFPLLIIIAYTAMQILRHAIQPQAHPNASHDWWANSESTKCNGLYCLSVN